MIRGTTPPVIITLPEDFIVANITSAYLSFEQWGEKVLEKALSEMSIDTESNSLIAFLTQENTLALSKGNVNFQLRFTYDNDAYATEQWKEPVDPIIKEGVI